MKALRFVAIGLAAGLALSAGTVEAVWKDPVQAVGAESRVFTGADGEVLRVDTVAPDIFRVRVRRGETWSESPMNRYSIFARPAEASSGAPRAAVSFEDGRLRVRSSVSAADLSIEAKIVGKGYEVRFPLTADERIFGLGDASRENLQRRPGVYEIWVKNMTCYIPIPAAFSSEGWGVLMNTSWRNRFDVGETDRDAMVCTAAVSELDFYLFVGDGYRALLDAYTRLTGRPSMLPVWGYGFTYVCNTSIDRFFLMTEAREMRREHLPCDVIGLEPGWMEKHYDGTTKKNWSLARFGSDMVNGAVGSHTWTTALSRMGFKLSLWLCCGYDLFRYEEQCAAGVARKLGRQPDLAEDVSECWVDDRIEKGIAGEPLGGYTGKKQKHAEFEANFKEGDLPWFEHLKKFIDQGARGFKLDGSWQVTDWNGVPDRKWANGMDNEEAHNLYPLVYAKQMARGYEEYMNRRAMIYSAGGYAGVQQYVATWAGDTGGGRKTLASVLNLGMSGHPHQSCDTQIQDPPSLHYGFLSPWTEHNNWGAWRQAWYQDDDKIDQFRYYDELRYRLLPYIYTTAAEACRTGWPIARPLAYVYPEVRAYDNLATTYLLGPNLLVSAFAKETEIPSGVWYDWLTDEPVTGPCKVPFKRGGLLGGGLFVKAGAILPIWSEKRQHVERGCWKKLDFHVWPGADGEGELYEDDGTNLDYRKGCYAIVPLSVARTEAGAVFTIGRRHGTANGSFSAPGDPDYAVVFHVPVKPASVTVDGQPAEGVWDAEKRIFTVRLGAVPIVGRRVEIVKAD